MKKKIIALCLIIVLAATAVIGGTLAYFTDTDSAKNVMTTGNVKIYQNEQQSTLDDEVDNDAQHQNIRVANDGLEDFQDNKKMVPTTDKPEAQNWIEIPGATAGYYLENDNGTLIDKIVTVTNEGTEDAYIRTLMLFEMGKLDTPEKIAAAQAKGYALYKDKDNDTTYWCSMIESDDKKPYVGFTGYDLKEAFHYEKIDGQDTYAIVKVGDTYYNLMYGTYDYNKANDKACALEPGKTSDPSLTQVWLNSWADNFFYDMVGEKYDILVLTQAIQTAGFDTAAEAFEAEYGVLAANLEADGTTLPRVTAEMEALVGEWFANVK